MKTKFRNLGIVFVLALAVLGVNATEFKSSMEIKVEPGMEICLLYTSDAADEYQRV